jgi:DNA-binding HxlR family transcriptional regulator
MLPPKLAVLEAITDKTTSNILKTIASAASNSDILITELKLTRKQYYSRMSSLTNAGLVKRQRGRYLLTAFGKVIFSAQKSLETKIESALNNYWKLKAIDSLEMPSREENDKVISMLIDNQEIKGILINDLLSPDAVNEKPRDMERTLVTVPNFL